MTFTNKRTIRILSVLTALLVIVAVCALWLDNASYPAGETACAALLSNEGVTVSAQGNLTVFIPEEVKQGFVFYPGGLVESAAYAPLLRALAQEGWLCVLAEMPFDLAVLDMNAAADIPALFPQAENWAIGGHSLGGAMAASFAAGHPGMFDTLVLLAAYATEDLSHSGLQVYSLYGSEDGVMNRDKYAQYRPNLPGDTVEVVIEGGNHALFGDYGAQKGDGTPTIPPEEQIRQTVAVLTSQ